MPAPFAYYCDPARLRAERGHALVLGHRGLPGSGVENRIEAFQAAIDAGADGVEFDVQLAADGVPMVVHDARLDRTTGQSGRVADFTAAELERLGLPRLETVLDRLGHPTGAGGAGMAAASAAVLNVEIKDLGARDRGLERSAVELVKAKRMEGQVLFSSFNPMALGRLRRIDPRFYAAQLTGPGWLRAFRLGYLRCPGAIHPHFSEVTPTKLEAWRRRCWRVVAWGADSEAELSAALGWGLDGIITDRPVEAVGLLP